MFSTASYDAQTAEPMLDPRLAEFATAYSLHRQAEGRQLSDKELLALPWLTAGPQARQWAVRACTYQAFVDKLLEPMAERLRRSLTVLDLGAGNGWLSYRVAGRGHRAIALDIRGDSIEGLGAVGAFVSRCPGRIERVVASFDAIPLPDRMADIALFNASLHYATDLVRTLAEAARVTRRRGLLAILDSPFYPAEADGMAMQAEKQQLARATFGDRAGALTALPFVEFLTPERLAAASSGLGLVWKRQLVRYPLRHELRPLLAKLCGRRRPSRFDLWMAQVP
jgi:SAM-dependent methyltransferase